MVNIDADFSQPFSKQVEFFRAKLGNQVTTEKWADMLGEAHNRAFTVAGATKADLLADLATAVDKSLNEGGSLQSFQADFDKIAAQYGWQYKGDRNWRTRTIYMTNLRTAHAAGRLAQLREADYPHWMYRHSGSSNPRHQHKAWNGLILPANDPFWQTHYPPNGFGCGCRAIGIRREADAKRYGGYYGAAPPLEIDQATGTPKGIGKGWDYMPGSSSSVRGFSPELVDSPPQGKPVMDGPVCKFGTIKLAEGECPGPTPKPRPFDTKKLLATGLSEVEYVQAFLKEFGASIGNPVTFKDATGQRLVISDELFINRKKTAKEGQTVYKILKRERNIYLPMLAQTIIDPQEIWMVPENIMALGGKLVYRRRYLAWWQLEEDEKPGLAVFESIDQQLWTGVTTFVPETGDVEQYMANIRSVGVLEYKKRT